MVAVSGTMDAPRVLERRRIVIADPELPGSKQPYHAAVDLPLREAEVRVTRAMESSRALALDSIVRTLQALRLQGHEVAGCGLLLGSGQALPELAKILASHALIHTAEGQMFRDVLSWAARECGLTITAMAEKQIPSASVDALGSLGKQIGPPWTQDQKYATIAALLSLERADVEDRRAMASVSR
jgi:hypothetical protein